MATSLADFAELHTTVKEAQRPEPLRPALFLATVLTPLAVGIHGYHPYAEDGGLYLAGIKYLLDPTLYPHGTAFVTSHLRLSLFAPAVAALIRLTRAIFGGTGMRGLEGGLLALHMASIWTALLAMGMLARRTYRSVEAEAGAIVLLGCWLTLPVAGTSLLLMDPYLTARSISTPCVLLALVGAIDMARAFSERASNARKLRAALLCVGALTAGFAMHPLMSGYGAASALLLLCLGSQRESLRTFGAFGLCASAVLCAACLTKWAPQESAAYREVVWTRSYWFISTWRWYEIFGLIAPLAILAGNFATQRRKLLGDSASHGRELAKLLLFRTAVIAGAMSGLVALLFAQPQAASHMVARLQPLRTFQIVYVVMILSLGAVMGERVLRRRPWRWALALILLGGVMFTAERIAYPASSHIERSALNSPETRNPWLQAFFWIRANTSKDAMFALKDNYIAAPGEDAQGFRAAAERSALPDYSKDGGEASINPSLAAAWIEGVQAQHSLEASTDRDRAARLLPLGVTWIVISTNTVTATPCPYRNEAVKVCHIP